MIIANEKDQLINWLEDNRHDKDSDVPYVIPNEVLGGYEFPNDELIFKGLKELGLDYAVVESIRGVSVEIQSIDLIGSDEKPV